MIKGYNKYERIAESLQGFYTLETLADRLNITPTKAVYVVHRLRKLGFVKTSYGAGKKRVYQISLKNKQKGISYAEKINEALSNPAIQVMESNSYYVYGRTPSYEEALIYAIKQKDVRYLIASLALFKKISNWSYLYKLAKKEGLLPQIVALYEIARKNVRKIRKMPRRFLNQTRKIKTRKIEYIIKPISSDDFKSVEKKWRVYIPLNQSDLEEYHR